VVVNQCPVCANSVAPYQYEHPNGARVDCLVCGTYRLMEQGHQRLWEMRGYIGGVIEPLWRLSGALRQRAESKRGSRTRSPCKRNMILLPILTRSLPGFFFTFGRKVGLAATHSSRWLGIETMPSVAPKDRKRLTMRFREALSWGTSNARL
jgi:hypothetical protein